MGIILGTGQQKIAAMANLITYYCVGLPLGISLMFAAGLRVVGIYSALNFMKTKHNFRRLFHDQRSLLILTALPYTCNRSMVMIKFRNVVQKHSEK